MAWINIGICLTLSVLATAVQPAHRRRERADSLRFFAAFPHGVAAFTSSNNTAFKCLTATRTRFDPRAKTVTYVWHLKSISGHPRRDIVFDVSFGGAAGQGSFFVNHDTTSTYTAFYEYSDYATCAVTRSPLEGCDHCMLWVKKAVQYNVPKHCLDKYEETCEYRVPLIDRGLCKEEDD
ncbi:uncharacterized protein LOC144134712 [Amblyomma americanum]